MGTLTNGPFFLARLPHDKDLSATIREAFLHSGASAGWFSVIGATKKAVLAFYDQQEKSYREILFDQPGEILMCTGNVSTMDGGLFVHAHLTLGFEDGTTRGGHLMEGTILFAGELFGVVFQGGLERAYDDVTGLKLWKP
jgi:hypothetical protein